MKKFIKILICAASVAFLYACEDNDYPQYYYEFVNSSEHVVEIEITTEQTSSTMDTYILLQPNDTYRWKRADFELPPIIMHSNTKVIFTFDNEYKMIFINEHYAMYSPIFRGNYEQVNGKKNRRDHIYTFTEEIYEYAKFLNEQGLVYAGSEKPGWELPKQYQGQEN